MIIDDINYLYDFLSTNKFNIDDIFILDKIDELILSIEQTNIYLENIISLIYLFTVIFFSFLILRGLYKLIMIFIYRG